MSRLVSRAASDSLGETEKEEEMKKQKKNTKYAEKRLVCYVRASQRRKFAGWYGPRTDFSGYDERASEIKMDKDLECI